MHHAANAAPSAPPADSIPPTSQPSAAATAIEHPAAVEALPLDAYERRLHDTVLGAERDAALVLHVFPWAWSYERACKQIAATNRQLIAGSQDRRLAARVSA